MSSKNSKNTLKCDNGSLSFGENYSDLLPGLQSPASFADIDLRIINSAIKLRKANNAQEHDNDHEHHPEAGSRQKINFDHSLAFFERTIRRIAPHIEEARAKRVDQQADEAVEAFTRGLAASDEVIAEEVASLAVAGLSREIASKELDLFNIFTDEEFKRLHRNLAADGIRIESPPTANETVNQGPDQDETRHQ